MAHRCCGCVRCTPCHACQVCSLQKVARHPKESDVPRQVSKPAQGGSVALDIDWLDVASIRQTSITLDALPLRWREARILSAIQLVCGRKLSSRGAERRGAKATFYCRDKDDRVIRDPTRAREADNLLRCALRHTSANQALVSFELAGVPCPIKPLCAALANGLNGRHLQTFRLSHIPADGLRLKAIVKVLSGCAALSVVGLHKCSLSDTDMPEIVKLIQAVRRRRIRVRGQTRVQWWRETLRCYDQSGQFERYEAESEDPAVSESPLTLELAANAFGDKSVSLLEEHLLEDDTLQALVLDLRANRMTERGIHILQRVVSDRMESCKVETWSALELRVDGNSALHQHI
ncbi:hypothetical protein AB1Y20_018736 [Prymnesium parvum]|uniref:Uncharacterized protein n=1 Tax=Prymnesium parvum TaxID=97485 RepID=A0AB34JP47_PRYPA